MIISYLNLVGYYNKLRVRSKPHTFKVWGIFFLSIENLYQTISKNYKITDFDIFLTLW